MDNSVKTDDVIFNFFKQICDEKDDQKCVDLGNSWIQAMERNLNNMEARLDEKDKEKHKDDIMVDIYGGMQTEPLSALYTDSFPFSALSQDVQREVQKILTPKTGR